MVTKLGGAAGRSLYQSHRLGRIWRYGHLGLYHRLARALGRCSCRAPDHHRDVVPFRHVSAWSTLFVSRGLQLFDPPPGFIQDLLQALNLNFEHLSLPSA